jgi:dinuclear metal center YbgI/SA1388 family protein
MEISELATYLDRYLRVDAVPDFPGAANGLQVSNSGRLTRVALAVDATQATIEMAVADSADLLLVHHGLFWDREPRITGRRHARLKRLMETDIAVYSAHLPLDVHPDVGNNAVLARELGIAIEGRFGGYQGEPLGYWGTLDLRRESLAARLDEKLGSRVRLIAGGPERVRRVGVITGGAGSEITAARAAGLDAFITGEGGHHNYFDATEGGINLYLGGHYATEVWGVRALGAHIEQTFGLPWTFLDQPTGL